MFLSHAPETLNSNSCSMSLAVAESETTGSINAIYCPSMSLLIFNFSFHPRFSILAVHDYPLMSFKEMPVPGVQPQRLRFSCLGWAPALAYFGNLLVSLTELVLCIIPIIFMYLLTQRMWAKHKEGQVFRGLNGFTEGKEAAPLLPCKLI